MVERGNRFNYGGSTQRTRPSRVQGTDAAFQGTRRRADAQGRCAGRTRRADAPGAVIFAVFELFFLPGCWFGLAITTTHILK